MLSKQDKNSQPRQLSQLYVQLQDISNQPQRNNMKISFTKHILMAAYSLVPMLGVAQPAMEPQPPMLRENYITPEARNQTDGNAIQAELERRRDSQSSAERKKLKELQSAYAAQRETERLAYQKAKDANVLKQGFTKSCGAAALANLLTYFHNAPVTEKQLLDSIAANSDVALTMKDIKEMASRRGFKMAGYRVNLSTLSQLKQAVIVRVDGSLRDESRKFAYLDNLPPPDALSSNAQKPSSQMASASNPVQDTPKNKTTASSNEAQLNPTAAPVSEALPAPKNGEGHFVVLEKIDNGIAYIKDPQTGNIQVGLKNFLEIWTTNQGSTGYVMGVVS